MKKLIVLILMSVIATQVFGQIKKYYPERLNVGEFCFLRYTDVSPKTYKAKYACYDDLRGIDRKTSSEISKKIRENLEKMGYEVYDVVIYNKAHDSGTLGITITVINREYQIIRDVQKRNEKRNKKLISI